MFFPDVGLVIQIPDVHRFGMLQLVRMGPLWTDFLNKEDFMKIVRAINQRGINYVQWVNNFCEKVRREHTKEVKKRYFFSAGACLTIGWRQAEEVWAQLKERMEETKDNRQDRPRPRKTAPPFQSLGGLAITTVSKKRPAEDDNKDDEPGKKMKLESS
jgi:hypothetical protein